MKNHMQIQERLIHRIMLPLMTVWAQIVQWRQIFEYINEEDSITGTTGITGITVARTVNDPDTEATAMTEHEAWHSAGTFNFVIQMGQVVLQVEVFVILMNQHVHTRYYSIMVRTAFCNCNGKLMQKINGVAILLVLLNVLQYSR